MFSISTMREKVAGRYGQAASPMCSPRCILSMWLMVDFFISGVGFSSFIKITVFSNACPDIVFLGRY